MSLSTTGNVEVEPVVVYHNWNLSIDNDESAVFSLAGTNTARINGHVEIFWSYPSQPLTLIIETPFTETQQSYNVIFDGDCLEAMTKVSQIIDGQEIEKKTSKDRSSLKSDSNYQVVLKLIPTDATAYGVYIRYHVDVEKIS